VRLGVAGAIVDGALLPGDVEIADGRVVAVGLAGAGQGLAVPGLVDLQVNGFAGIDFAHADAAGYALAGDRLAAAGTTSFQPTLVTASEAELVRALGNAARARAQGIMGVHLEGPFLAPARLGAHLPSARADPDAALLDRLLAAGPVSQMTLAPELPGALELIDLLHARGVNVSLGHSDATSSEAARAFDRGVRTVTHVFNAMRPFSHRDPGIAAAALVRPDVLVQMIVDGQHLDDDAVRLVWQAAGARVALVSDAIAAAGLGDGSFQLGPVEIAVRDGVARRADGVLAGSTGTLLAAVRNLAALGVPVVDAVAAATAIPARIARRPELGVLRPGALADIVVLDDRLELQCVLRAGVPVRA
jgi:N-acetylglucosamine-6-phosphate deacetylase